MTKESTQDNTALLSQDYNVGSMGEVQQYSVTPYRHVIVFLFCVSIIANLGLGICFTPIQYNLIGIFEEGIYLVTFSTRIIGNILTPIANFPTNYLLDKYGLKFGVLAANVCSLIALWVSSLCMHSFYYILIGQVFAAVGHAFLLSVPQKISLTWYPAEQRVMSTTIMAMAILLGNAIGAQFPNFFVDEDAITPAYKGQIFNMLYFMAILGSVLVAPTFFLFQSKPKVPPSKAAETKSIAYMQSLKLLFKNCNALVLVVGGSLVIGTNMTIAAVLQLILRPFNFTNETVGYCITFSIILGLPSSLLIGYYVGKTKKYKMTVLALGLGATASLVLIWLAAQTQDALIMKLAFCVFGLIVNPFYPITVEFLCEVSFPVAEVMAGGIFYTLSQVMGTLESFGADAILEHDLTSKEIANYTFYLLIFVDLAGVCLLAFSKQDLKRSYFESVPYASVYSFEESSEHEVMDSKSRAQY